MKTRSSSRVESVKSVYSVRSTPASVASGSEPLVIDIKASSSNTHVAIFQSLKFFILETIGFVMFPSICDSGSMEAYSLDLHGRYLIGDKRR